MRSKRMERSALGEDAFKRELDALDYGLRRGYKLVGDYSDERQRLYSVALRYIDELNKIRERACPLSTNMLLSSILESLLLALVLQHSVRARQTATWAKVIKEAPRRGEKISSDVPIFHLAELIQLVYELKLLRTSGVQKKVDLLLIQEMPSLATMIQLNTWDANRNHELMHKLRIFRNAVHPLQVISNADKDEQSEFVTAIWIGLRLLVLLNEMLGIESPLTR